MDEGSGTDAGWMVMEAPLREACWIGRPMGLPCSYRESVRRSLMQTVVALLSILALAPLADAGLASEPVGGADRTARPRTFLLHQRPPLALCFAPGTPEDEARRIEANLWRHWLSQHEGGVAFNLTTQWSMASGPNSPITLRWSLAPDGLTIPDAAGVGSGPNSIRQKLTATFGSVQAGVEVLRQCFEIWGGLSGVTYVEVPDDGAAWGSPGSATRGDVRIAAHPFNSANVLGYNQFPQDGDMVLNSSVSWGTPADDFRFFRNLVYHEHGHGLGILHVCPANESKLMEPFLSTAFIGPQHDDIRAVQRHYGDRWEPNNTAAGAAFIGGPGLDETLSPASIADASDSDWYRFEADAGSVLDATVSPVGFVYNSGTQFFIFCPNGSSVNSLVVHDLRLRLFTADGKALLADANANPAGQAESIAGFEFDAAGEYLLRVSGGAASNIQLYDLAVAVSKGKSPAIPGDLDGNGVVDGADLGILLNQWGSSGTAADLDGSGSVDGGDLAVLLTNWTGN